jgi:hypothetical protein
MLTAEGTNRYNHQVKKGLTAILQIFVGTLPLSADPGKVFFYQKFDFYEVLPASKTGDTGVQPPGIVKI